MLSKEQIANEVSKAKHSLVSAENYKNLSSWITVECSRGHIYDSSVEHLRKSIVCPQCSREIVDIKGYPRKKSKDVKKRLVAIDQATNVAGIAVYDDGKLVYAGTRNFYGELFERYSAYSYFLTREVINNWGADELVFEDIQQQNNVKTFKVLAGLWGISVNFATLTNTPFEVVSNKVWQSSFNIKGSSRAIQEQNVVKKVEELFGIKVPIDAADAVLLGYHRVLEIGVKLF